MSVNSSVTVTVAALVVSRMAVALRFPGGGP